MSGCIFKLLIPAPKRSFLPQDLLITQEDLPPEWTVASGPDKAGEYAKPPNSMEITLLKSANEPLPDGKQWEIRESLYIFYSVEAAKRDYLITTSFPGETNIEGWTFSSNLADEQKFSCYTYSNMDFPVCTWAARYNEIEVQVFGWIIPKRMTLNEFQDLIRKMDEKIVLRLRP